MDCTWMYVLIITLICSIQPTLQGRSSRRRDLKLRREAANTEECPDRQDPPPNNRYCQKPCVINRDCRSQKKSCKCDGVCGLSCIKHNQECPIPDTIPNGRVSTHPNTKFGSIAQYGCKDGYKLRGTQARVCQGDQSWSGSVPQCFQDHSVSKGACTAPPDIPNAIHDGSPERTTHELGTMVQYKCLPNYVRNQDAVLRAWCVGGGDWVGPNMTCISKDHIHTTSSTSIKGGSTYCPMLENIEHGWVHQDSTSTVGSSATYYCQRGYFLAGRANVVCEAGGHWSGVQPSCEKVTCSKPPTVENAVHDGDPSQEMYPSGAQVMYSCSYGYYADGQPRAMCSGDRNWIGLTLICSPQSCGFPGEIQDGWRTGYVFTYPSKVNYYCNDGFELEGRGYRVCEADGSWSESVPSCKPVSCPVLFAPVYGRMNGSGTSYGTIVRFECDDSYKVVGSTERRCQADRTWSGQTAKCEEINCGWPGPFYNGYLIGHKTTAGSTLFFSCKTRSSFDGKAFQTVCLETGEWSFPPPTCWGQCQIPSIPNAVMSGGRAQVYVDHLAEVNYTCDGGLAPRGGSRMRCNNGTWSHSPECVPAPCKSQPPHVANGLRVFMGRDHGFRAKYRCFAGYELKGMNSTYLTCTFGKWEGGTPRCETFFCPKPGTIRHGSIYKKVKNGRFDFKSYISTITHGVRLQYQCDEGYRLLGPSGATCVNGVWRPALDSKCVHAVHPAFERMWKPVSNMNT